MHQSLTKTATFLALILSAGSLPLAAATDGVTGFNSTGSLEIRLHVPDRVRVSQLQDIELTAALGADSRGRSSACIYRSGPGSYQITGIGSGDNGRFELGDGETQVPYQVLFGAANGATELLAGVPAGGQNGADIASSTCAGTGHNAHIEVAVPAAITNNLSGTLYTGTLTLVVAPD